MGEATRLFRHKHGPVNAEVWGPTEGFLWRDVDYFRWVRCAKEPGKWLKVRRFRGDDQYALERCVKAVRSWFKEQDEPLRRAV